VPAANLELVERVHVHEHLKERPMRMHFAVLSLATVLAMPAYAQNAGGSAGGQTAVNQQDKQFLDYAAQDNQAEIQTCLIAEKQAQAPAVKAFARLMADDHVQIESQLAATGSAEGVALPNGIGQDGSKTISRLEPLHGQEFDRAFLKDQIQDHTHDVQRYDHEIHTSQNSTVKNYADETLPILKQHLALAEAVQVALQTGKAQAVASGSGASGSHGQD
jgi:putative membrane protein